MNWNVEYLTDEELQKLMNEVEETDLVMAPPDIARKVLKKVSNERRSFAGYCFRVLASVAACIVLLFVLPEISEEKLANESKSFEKNVPTRQEVMMTVEWKTKEEALDDRDMFTKIIEKIGER